MFRSLALVLLIVFPIVSAALEVVDDSGNKVILSESASRIVSLAPHVTEQLFAIGAGENIVGAVEYSDYPEVAKTIPRVGGYSRLDLERLVALRPDLIIGWQSGNSSQQLERLEALGFVVYRSEPRRLEDIPRNMERLGVLTGNETEAGRQADAFRYELEVLRKTVADRPERSVFYQIWNRPLMTVNGEHLISEVIEACHGRNIFAELPALTPTVSEESVIAADPAVIIASGMGHERPEWLDAWRAWPQLQAVKNQALHVINPDLIQRATPRLLKGAKVVCRLLHP